MNRAFRVVLAIAGIALMPCTASSESAGQPPLDKVLARFDEVQLGVRTLSAQFTETTVNELLKEPMVARGRFYMTKPDSVMWEYTTPESMQFIIAKDEYVGYFPARKRAERRNIQRWRDQIFRFFGLGQVSSELKKFYEIRLEEPSREMKGTYALVLDPKKRRVKKRMESVRFWVDRDSFLPVKVEYRDQKGNTRVIQFHKMQLNPDLSAGLYNLSLPSDVTVTTGFGGIDGLGSTR
jgi:outer membrane lipoprotein-sorting protein